MSRLQAKVVLLGEGRVGKTSLVLRFCKDTFSESQPPTIQASFLSKRLSVAGENVSIAIWVRDSPYPASLPPLLAWT